MSLSQELTGDLWTNHVIIRLALSCTVKGCKSASVTSHNTPLCLPRISISNILYYFNESWRSSVRISVGVAANLTENFCVFPQSIQASYGIIS